MLTQFPHPGSFHLAWAGDLLSVTLDVNPARPGRALFRTTIGRAAIRRRELIESTESDEPVLACEWHDLPMRESAPGHYTIRIPLTEVGLFAGKACFFPEGESVPLWPEGEDIRIKVEPARTLCGNTMYTAFVRQFGPGSSRPETELQPLDREGYAVIPPSGTFRDLIGRLDTILGEMRFRILQLLPIFPTPTTFARMGRYGSPFAALDFLSVDPALAVFDPHATPLDQFRELADAVHRRGATLYLDLPANHTGWAATLQIHHPEWYRRHADGSFASPGAWGVTWEDLVELDYSDPGLRRHMAEVFLFWCRQGVDGFRCDAGYMIPVETWRYIVARVRDAYPDTIFLLEGLGGKLETTESLLIDANMNWAYSELFQTENRDAMEWYLPQAIERSERCGPLIHFAETHDNNRLAARGETYARMRVALSALLSHEGAFGMANGVEWFATEKIDVHGSASLNWGAPSNQIPVIARLNRLLSEHPSFQPGTHLRMVQQGGGNVLAILREREEGRLLVLANLDCGATQRVRWAAEAFPTPTATDLLTGETIDLANGSECDLAPGAVRCLSPEPFPCASDDPPFPAAIARQCRNLMAMRIRERLLAARSETESPDAFDPAALGEALARDPTAFCAEMNRTPFAPCVHWNAPQDLRRIVPVPDGFLLFLEAEVPFHAELRAENGGAVSGYAIPLASGRWFLFLLTTPCGCPEGEYRELTLTRHQPDGTRRDTAELLFLPSAAEVTVAPFVSGHAVRADLARCEGLPHAKARAFSPLHAALSNGAGAMAYVRAAWGTVRSQYDCLLGVNPDLDVPADKWIFWTRCRAWIRHRGYSHELTALCLTRFSADPAGRFAEWRFKVPCGMGHWIPIRFRLDMAHYENRVRLTVSRETDPDALPAEDEVTVIFRPDIEWRSFHAKTKAYLGAEQALPAAIRPAPNGFRFDLPGAMADVGLFLTGGAFHPEGEWHYSIDHPEERERGQEDSSDLYSPGWFDLTLRGGQSGCLVAGCGAERPFVPMSDQPPAESPIPLAAAASQALSLFVVKRDAFKTVIAGYPWFLDWGRDTLIVLRGLIADGRTRDALAILREFGRFEENGTLPNIIHGNTVGNRDTSDAPLWFCVAAGDLIARMGVKSVLNAPCGDRPLSAVIESILTHYRDGTPNGVKMDPESGLIFSPSHFTWMDTNYPAGTPREGYPVEIQALWIAALRLATRRINRAWEPLAEMAARSLCTRFAMPGGGLYDALRASPGTPAAQATPEDAIRPNQLLAVTLGCLPDRSLAESVLAVTEQLLIPGAIRSLADRPVTADMGIWRDGVPLNDPHHPYRGMYRGDEDTSRKPAYHNGTAWSWTFPLYAEAAFTLYGPAARDVCASLLASVAEPIRSGGCLGHIAEIYDGDAPHFARGCSAQAWGISEVVRVMHLLKG